MTTRIYYAEPWCREFDANVVAVLPEADGRARVYLDRSAFYPTSGGQPFDTGALGVATVVDVVDEDDGRVAHVVSGPVTAGEAVHGVVDWGRRFDHMQQHTGQHVLSAAFDALHQARTESFHLGTETSTIDLSREVSPAEITSAETLANEVVWDDRPVGIRFVSDAEAARLPFRKPPARGGRLRVIDVDGFDLSACGGTHVSRTGEVGVIAVHSWERYKGGTRIAFVCGRRALAAYRTFRDAVTGAIRVLSVFPHELPDGIARLQAANKDAQREIKGVREQLGRFEGLALAARAEPLGPWRVVIDAVTGYDAGSIKPLVQAACPADGAAVLFSDASPAIVAAARGASATGVDCGGLVRALCERFGGKGGGRPELAQGGGLSGDSGALTAFAREWLAQRASA